MNLIRIPLNTSAEQAQRLRNLQEAFSVVCNALSPVVRQTRCWNRVALHHLAYHKLRENFPQVGSQMVCNAIYSVCRTSRLVFQHPASPFNVGRLGERPLPLLRFSDKSPVYFDRHTLSIKDRQLSLYTLDGRIRFQLALQAEDEARFKTSKLRETVLSRTAQGGFELAFLFSEATVEEAAPAVTETAEIPEYVVVEEAA